MTARAHCYFPTVDACPLQGCAHMPATMTRRRIGDAAGVTAIAPRAHHTGSPLSRCARSFRDRGGGGVWANSRRLCTHSVSTRRRSSGNIERSDRTLRNSNNGCQLRTRVAQGIRFFFVGPRLYNTHYAVLPLEKVSVVITTSG